jgi:hypothetical protein
VPPKTGYYETIIFFFIWGLAIFLLPKIYCPISKKINSSQIIWVFAIYFNREAREEKPSKYVSLGANTLAHIHPFLALIAPLFGLFTPFFDLVASLKNYFSVLTCSDVFSILLLNQWWLLLFWLCIVTKCEKMVLFELSTGTKGKFRILQKKN